MQCVFQNCTEMLQMGGYGFYVWSSYGLMAMGLLCGMILPLRQYRRLIRSARHASKT